jgi:hypothetical protein
MKLGELIKAIERVSADRCVYIEPYGLTPGWFSSYRGYYDQLALGYRTGHDRVNAGELLALARAACGDTFEGYKGGSYRMDADTEVWLSNYGETSGVSLARVEITDWCVYLHGEKVD